MDEDLLVLSALADSNRPKFLAEDMLLFNSIISDLFPGFEVRTALLPPPTSSYVPIVTLFTTSLYLPLPPLPRLRGAAR